MLQARNLPVSYLGTLEYQSLRLSPRFFGLVYSYQQKVPIKRNPYKELSIVIIAFTLESMKNGDGSALMDTDTALSNTRALVALVAHLRRHHGSAVNAVLYYGSCLRNQNPFEGIVDLYLITDSYTAVYPSKFRAFINWLLPPNVFYEELAVGDRMLRVKYNVLSSTDLRRGLSGRWMHSYLWGRFCQPVEILWSRDEEVTNNIESCLRQAVKTFLDRVLPKVTASGTVSDLWEQGLRLSYSAELRSEGPVRAQQLVDYALDHYISVSKAAAATLRYPLEITGTGETARYTVTVPALSRHVGRWVWVVRRIHGKMLSVARLLKSLFTFEGGLDYAAWKLGRHSGQSIEIPDRVRRYPLIFVWGLLWKLYRDGIIR